jgi:hypothetical protein
MMYPYDYVSDIIGMNTDAQILPIHKLEPEIIPTEDVFGIADRTATRELISVLKDNTINRINICFPLDEKDEKLVKLTFEAIQNMLEGGIRVSMSNIDTIDKVKFAQQECRNNISYFTKATAVPMVEQYCRDNNIPFLPGASNITEFLQREAQ